MIGVFFSETIQSLQKTLPINLQHWVNLASEGHQVYSAHLGNGILFTFRLNYFSRNIRSGVGWEFSLWNAYLITLYDGGVSRPCSD